jgi:K+-transporting ATPase A subunit
MQANMGTIDRVIRLLVAVVIGALYLGGRLSGTLAIILGIVAVAFLATSLVGWCPAYLPFGLSTRRRNG